MTTLALTFSVELKELVVVPPICPSLRHLEHLEMSRAVSINYRGTSLNVPNTKEFNESFESPVRCSVFTSLICEPARSELHDCHMNERV